MATVAVSKEKLDGLAEAVGSKSETRVPLTIDEMRERVLGLELGITPSGTKRITSNGTHDVTEYASATVNVRPKLQYKSIEPTTEFQYVYPDPGYQGLDEVEVQPIPSNYGLITYDGSTITVS